jgi:hypothetical protein
MLIFHKIENVPVHSMLTIKTRELALNYPKGDIALGFCSNCGFISNCAFRPELLKYSTDCEESQGFSPTFRTFAQRIANSLIEKYTIRQKRILEIGCGQAEFLRLLCDIGDNQGIGFDPVYSPGREQSQTAGRVKVIRDFYSEQYADYYGDLVCCQMTLEHIHKTSDFLRMIRASQGDRLETILFFQVPNVVRILQEGAFEDIYYEHCSYFSSGSLAHLFQLHGFEILDIRTEYDEQYLVLEAKPCLLSNSLQESRDDEIARLEASIHMFQRSHRAMLNSWRLRLQQAKEQQRRVVLWGAGSKAVAFLAVLEIYNDIEYVVDINPYRQNSYVAGTGQLIVAPEFLRDYQPDIVIIMNSIYRKEIQMDLSKMGLTPEILALGQTL